MPKIIVTADDYGLTRGITDSIIGVADKGGLTCVSVIPNGYAVDHALDQWQKRKAKLSLSIHFNLTEGKALSDPYSIPHLVNVRGEFQHSPFWLLLKSIFLFGGTKEQFMAEIEKELLAQREYISARVGGIELAADGHQYVHMIPLVFRVFARMHSKKKFSYIRIPLEPFFIPHRFSPTIFTKGLARHLTLNSLALVNKPIATLFNMPCTDFFVGTFLSGQLDLTTIRSVLGEIQKKKGSIIEIVFHPGEATLGELENWGGDIKWHYSSWRARERETLESSEFAVLLRSFLEDSVTYIDSSASRIKRFFIAGIIATTTNVSLLYLLTEFLGLWYIISGTIAFIVSTIVGFLLQKFWTFSHDSLLYLHKETILFILNNFLGLVFTITGLYLLVEYVGLWYLVAQILLLVFVATWNFFIYSLVIFKSNHR